MLLYFISNQVSYSYQSFTAHLRLKENEAVFVPSLTIWQVFSLIAIPFNQMTHVL